MIKLPKISLNSITNFLKDRSFKHGTNAIVLTLLVLGIIWFIGVILDKHPLQIDTTSNKQHSLSPQTIKILNSLSVKVKVTAFIRSGAPSDKYTGEKISDLLKNFSKRTANLTVELIDVDVNPLKARLYNIRSYNSVVFENGPKKKEVTHNEIFVVDDLNPYAPRQQAEFQGEQAFINAILTVTKEKQKVICFTEGHKELDLANTERDGLSELSRYIAAENYQVKKINISKEGKIPDDCDVLVIAGPKVPFLSKEAELIEEYLKKGGKAVFLLGPVIQNTFMKTNLENVLLNWNIKLEDSIIVDPKKGFFSPLIPIPEYKTHSITEPLSKVNATIFFPLARGISDAKKKFEGRNIKKDELLETSGTAWAETDFKSQKPVFEEGKDLKGPLVMAVAVSEMVKEEQKKEDKEKSSGGLKETQFVVVGNSDFIMNAPGGIMGAKSNVDFFMNSVNWMLKENEKISIRAKKTDIRELSLTPTKTKVMFYTTIIVIPLLVIASGVFVWWKRRTK